MYYHMVRMCGNLLCMYVCIFLQLWNVIKYFLKLFEFMIGVNDLSVSYHYICFLVCVTLGMVLGLVGQGLTFSCGV